MEHSRWSFGTWPAAAGVLKVTIFLPATAVTTSEDLGSPLFQGAPHRVLEASESGRGSGGRPAREPGPLLGPSTGAKGLPHLAVCFLL